MSRRLATSLTALTLVLAGCGADDEPAPLGEENQTSPTLPSATASPTPTPTPSPTPPTATAPSAPAPPPDAGVPEGHGGEDQEGGAGDEEAARTPVDLVLDGEGLTPVRVEVAPFLGIEVTVRNDLPSAAELEVPGRSAPVRLPAGESTRFELEGLRTDRSYTLDAGPGQDARVVAAAAPGP